MAPLRKISREDIIEVALKILRIENIDSINVRRIAKELNCSVQPIFYNFKNMDDLKKEIIKEIENKYFLYIKNGAKSRKAYKGMGLSYIKFAIDYPSYFKVLFMSDTKFDLGNYIGNNEYEDEIIREGMQFTGLSFKEQKDFHFKVWVFTHGLAVLLANKTIDITTEEVDKLLEKTVREMLRGLKEERK